MSDRSAETPRGARRRFLEVVATLLFAIPVLGPVLLALRVVLAPARRRRPALVATLPLAEIPADGVRRFQLRFTRQHGAFVERVSRPVFLRRKGAGVVALSAECTHLGCNVRFDAAAGRFACPCHGGVFDLDGNVVGGPPPRPLRRLEVVQPKDSGTAVQVRV